MHIQRPAALALIVCALAATGARAQERDSVSPYLPEELDLNAVLSNSALADLDCGEPPPPPPERTFYNAGIAFDAGTDTLCFNNDRFDSGTPGLRQIANRFGACHGVVAVARALKERVSFRCDGPRMTRAQIRSRVRKALDLHQAGCAGTVEITGYCHTRAVCAAHEGLFHSMVVDENADLSISEALPHVLDLRRGSGGAEVQKRNFATLAEVYYSLQRGEAPLLLYPWHVILVTGIEFATTTDGYEARLTVYDPNDRRALRKRTFRISPEFDRTIDEEPVFIVTGHQAPSASCRERDERHGFPL